MNEGRKMNKSSAEQYRQHTAADTTTKDVELGCGADFRHGSGWK